MPSQHDYLVTEELREELRRREPSAERKLAQRFNRGRRPESRLGVTPPGSDYGRYDGGSDLRATGHSIGIGTVIYPSRARSAAE